MGRFRRTGEAISLAQVIELYLEDVTRMHTAKTSEAYRGPLRLFSRHLRATLDREPLLSDLTHENALGWMDALKREPKRLRGGLATGSAPVAVTTVRSYMRTLRVYSRWLTKPPYRLCAVDPLADLKLPRATRRFKQPLGQAELNALLSAPDLSTIVGARDRAMLLMLLDGGLRATELAHLRRGDLALDQSTIYIAHAKFDQSRIIALGHATLAELRAYLLVHEQLVCGAATTVDGSYTHLAPDDMNAAPLFPTVRGDFFTYQGLKSWFRRIAAKAGVPAAHLHLLRHTSAAQTLNAGADVRTVQLKLGHRDISTTQRYLHLAQAQITEREQRYSPVDYLGLGQPEETPRGRRRRTPRSAPPLWRRTGHANTRAVARGTPADDRGDRGDRRGHDGDDDVDDDGADGTPVGARR